MNIEERLVRDIEAAVGGVVMTESDLREARMEVAARVDDRRKRDRRLAVAAAGAAAVVITVVGVAISQVVGDDDSAPPVNPAPSSPQPSFGADDESFLIGGPPTPEELAGVWRVDNGFTLVRFAPPDQFSYTSDGRLFGAPAGRGTYTLDGDLVTVSLEEGCDGRTFKMHAALRKPGALRLAHTHPGFYGCTDETTAARWVMEQVLPPSKAITGLVLSNELDADGEPLTDPEKLAGDWFSEGGGHVLEILSTGSYTVADDSGEVVDRGQWSLDGATLTLTSSTDSPECDAGDLLVLAGMEWFRSGTAVMGGTAGPNDCGGAWASATWLLLPDGDHG